MAHGHHGHRHRDGFDDGRLAAAIEVEGELAAGLTDQAIARCTDALAGATVDRVLDLGCGPGVGTAQLAAAFPAATVVAADGSATMLARAGARAARLGLGDRVAAHELDLDGDLGAAGPCDLVWAAMALHHARDELATLRAVRALLRPGGLVCLLERAEPTAVWLADDLGRPGLWERVDAARATWYARNGATLPGAEHPERHPELLVAAGLELVRTATLHDTVTAPGDPATRRFVAARLRGAARDFAELADADDLAAIAAAADGGLDGARVTMSRLLLLARAHA